jgi:2-polyprenyl-3-methyl-5-hydroxy-6-metoxy-1,4-benzoquinol methylase
MTDSDPKYRLESHREFGFLQVRPTPSAQEITRFYADEFYSTQYPKLNNSLLEVQIQDREFHEAHWNDIGDAIEGISGRSLRGQKILDVGCGWALALRVFSGRGADCFGFDPAPEAVEYAQRQGLNVRVAGMETAEVFPGERFDVVTLLNVLEHLADPVSVMRQLRDRVLKPGGVLVVEVPNEFNALQVCAQKSLGLREWWVSPPAHLNYFNGESLSRLLAGTGFTVASLEASFPMELFLLFGENYVADSTLGRRCHERRIAFETRLRENGYGGVLRDLYQSLARQNLGRQVTAYALSQGSGR